MEKKIDRVQKNVTKLMTDRELLEHVSRHVKDIKNDLTDINSELTESNEQWEQKKSKKKWWKVLTKLVKPARVLNRGRGQRFRKGQGLTSPEKNKRPWR